MEIKYKVNEFDQCDTKCPHKQKAYPGRNEMITLVGSALCSDCQYHTSIDLQSQTVTCNHPGETNGDTKNPQLESGPVANQNQGELF